MKRYVTASKQLETVDEIDAFLDAIERVCRKYKLSISHEDHHGNFLIRHFNDVDLEWMWAATDARIT